VQADGKGGKTAGFGSVHCADGYRPVLWNLSALALDYFDLAQ